MKWSTCACGAKCYTAPCGKCRSRENRKLPDLLRAAKAVYLAWSYVDTNNRLNEPFKKLKEAIDKAENHP